MNTPRLCFVLALIGLLMILAGCGTPEIKYVDRITVVEKPVAINCIKIAPTRPEYVTEFLPPTASDLEYADGLATDWASSRAYEQKMEAAVQACLMK